MGRAISDIMTPQPECCTPEDGVIEVARIMESRDVGLVPIVESQHTRRVVGVVTDRDLILRVVAPGRDPNEVVTVGEVMTTELVCCTPDDEITTVAERMQQHRLRRILVCDGEGAVVGIVSTADLAQLPDETKLGDTMRAISQP